MEFASNRLGDVFSYYLGVLGEIYGGMEARSMLFLLFEYQLDFSRVKILSDAGERLSESEILNIHKSVVKLKKHIPLQYIIGETTFLDLRIMVEPGVLIPRPETEELVQWVVEVNVKRNESLNILDIGTGSACIAIALDRKLSNAKVFAIDNSEKAIAIARENSRLNQSGVVIEKADLFEFNLPHAFPAAFDIIVSNPPYVRESEKEMMHDNVLDFEPAEALFVKDEDPLLYYRAILEMAEKFLKKNGSIFFEINENMQGKFLQLLSGFPAYRQTFKKDLSNKTRMLKLDL
ncbi:MAG: peptide chain release factor N(5)-glutamine methyltransferase [Bacteroidota bacterium]|nr:peptide chain release factor N(5)-glutamine methyltransferase [Bacteroidota bacterium]